MVPHSERDTPVHVCNALWWCFRACYGRVKWRRSVARPYADREGGSPCGVRHGGVGPIAGTISVILYNPRFPLVCCDAFLTVGLLTTNRWTRKRAPFPKSGQANVYTVVSLLSLLYSLGFQACQLVQIPSLRVRRIRSLARRHRRVWSCPTAGVPQARAQWFVNKSTGGTLIQQFGIAGDIPLPSAYVRWLRG